jgi:hypothetical protein
MQQDQDRAQEFRATRQHRFQLMFSHAANGDQERRKVERF